MEIILYINSSEKNKIGKTLTTVDTLTGAIKQPSSITHPEIVIEYNNPVSFNYCYIDTFGRYYFVDDVVVMRNNVLKLSLSVDVLESFKTTILAQNVIVDKSYNIKEMYLPDENLLTLVKTKTDIVNFPNGLLESGEFILITAGG